MASTIDPSGRDSFVTIPGAPRASSHAIAWRAGRTGRCHCRLYSMTVEPPSAAELANIYGATGRELKALEAQKGMDSTIDLWPRYRWIRINDMITTPERRARAAEMLERLRLDIKASH